MLNISDIVVSPIKVDLVVVSMWWSNADATSYVFDCHELSGCTIESFVDDSEASACVNVSGGRESDAFYTEGRTSKLLEHLKISRLVCHVVSQARKGHLKRLEMKLVGGGGSWSWSQK